MSCHYHPDSDSVNRCSVCSKFLCSSCSHTIKGKVYCQDCIVAGAELAKVASTQRFANYSAARAALFAIVPGLGAVYNRQYMKAVTHFSIFAGLTILGDQGMGIFILGAISFYVFMMVDSFRSAQAIMRQQATHPELLQEEDDAIEFPVWGGVLILMGVVFFLHNLGIFNLRDIARFTWPLVFILVGCYLILDYWIRGGKSSNRGDSKRIAASETGPSSKSSQQNPPEE